MKDGNWFGFDKRASALLPKKRAFSEFEALGSLQIDIDNYAHKLGKEPQTPEEAITLLLSQVGIAAYASLWRWSWNKTSRFIRELGTNTGYLAGRKGRNKGKPIRLILNNLPVIPGSYGGQTGDIPVTSYNPQSLNLNPENENKEKGTGKRKKKTLTDNEYLEYLKLNPAYFHLDIEKEKNKCEAWHRGQGGELTRKKLINWLNRADRPMGRTISTEGDNNGTRTTKYTVDIEG